MNCDAIEPSRIASSTGVLHLGLGGCDHQLSGIAICCAEPSRSQAGVGSELSLNVRYTRVRCGTPGLARSTRMYGDRFATGLLRMALRMPPTMPWASSFRTWAASPAAAAQPRRPRSQYGRQDFAGRDWPRNGPPKRCRPLPMRRATRQPATPARRSPTLSPAPGVRSARSKVTRISER